MKTATKLIANILVLWLVLGMGAAASAQQMAPANKAAPKAAANTLSVAKKAPEEEGETQIARKDVPAAVMSAFEKAYPNATIKGYSKEMEKGKTIYEVESMEGKTHRDVTYYADGKLLMVEGSVEMKDVPPAVQRALEKKFPKAKVDLAEKVMAAGSVGYEFHVTTAAGKKAEVKFDALGIEVKS